jgi:hypothetical protein
MIAWMIDFLFDCEPDTWLVMTWKEELVMDNGYSV